MKASDLRNMTKEELNTKQFTLREELMQLRFKAKMGKLEKPTRISQIRRDVARILTVLKEGSYASAGAKKKA